MDKHERVVLMADMLCMMAYLARDVDDLYRWQRVHRRLTVVLANYASS